MPLRHFLRFFRARFLRSLYGSRGFGLALFEFLDASRGVYELLFTGVERVAVGADFNVNFGFCGAGIVGLPTGAADLGFRKVFRVYVFFGHNVAYYTRLDYLCKSFAEMEGFASQGVIEAPAGSRKLP